jgi:hypothetical protein
MIRVLPGTSARAHRISQVLRDINNAAQFQATARNEAAANRKMTVARMRRRLVQPQVTPDSLCPTSILPDFYNVAVRIANIAARRATQLHRNRICAVPGGGCDRELMERFGLTPIENGHTLGSLPAAPHCGCGATKIWCAFCLT